MINKNTNMKLLKTATNNIIDQSLRDKNIVKTSGVMKKNYWFWLYQGCEKLERKL